MKDSKPIGGIGPGAGPGVRERVALRSAKRAEKNALLGRMYNAGPAEMQALLRKEVKRG